MNAPGRLSVKPSKIRKFPHDPNTPRGFCHLPRSLRRFFIRFTFHCNSPSTPAIPRHELSLVWVFLQSKGVNMKSRAIIEQSSKQFASAVQALERIQRSGIKEVA